MVPPCRPRALAAELGGTLATPNFRELPFQRLSGNSERAPLRGLTSLRNRTKGHHLDASRYRKTRDPTRAASFHTVSGRVILRSSYGRVSRSRGTGAARRALSLAAGFLRLRDRVGVSVGDLPLAILTSVDLRHTQNVAPRLAVDRHLRPLVPGGECHLTDHVRSDDLVHVRGAVREGVGEVVKQVA